MSLTAMSSILFPKRYLLNTHNIARKAHLKEVFLLFIYTLHCCIIVLHVQELVTLSDEEKDATNAKSLLHLGVENQRYLFGIAYGPETRSIVIAEGETVTVNGSAGELLVNEISFVVYRKFLSYISLFFKYQ